jgi:hypothetical protein
MNANGVPSSSPGLMRRKRIYPGIAAKRTATLKGLHHSAHRGCNPFRIGSMMDVFPG